VQWYRIVGPSNMPRPIVTRLYTKTNNEMNLPELRKKRYGDALKTMSMTPQTLGKYI
jgi:tripartite-type tricarboxylate transporter receptor subunit TctC